MPIAVAASDASFRQELAGLLAGSGHRPLECAGAAAAAALARSARPRLLVLGPLHDEPAPALLRELRRDPATRRLPVLCVDPRAATGDAASLLEAGADDAITRSFQAPVFLARVRALLRRAAEPAAPARLSGGPIELELVSRQALVAGRAVELNRREFELLSVLLAAPNRAFCRAELLAAMWDDPMGEEGWELERHLDSLRRKLGAAGQLLQDSDGEGYRFSLAAER